MSAATGLATALTDANSGSDSNLDIAGRRVMICEDEPLIAFDIASGVEELGGEVLGPFAAVCEALAALDRHLPDLALLDVNLIDGDVTPVLLRLVAARVPVVVNTGTRLPEEAVDLGVPVFLKPTDPSELIAAVVGLR